MKKVKDQICPNAFYLIVFVFYLLVYIIPALKSETTSSQNLSNKIFVGAFYVEGFFFFGMYLWIALRCKYNPKLLLNPNFNEVSWRKVMFLTNQATFLFFNIAIKDAWAGLFWICGFKTNKE